ncbi:MAG: hypothetical protein GX941_02805 [Candidatus Methanofastidiosa archaeon]|jgi:hypothetical protein|nr:hypothetical protein [Candidatus Methanofastidiosa archaeon]
MKKKLLVFSALFLICTMAMCVNQAKLPDTFTQTYEKIETTQKEIETIYSAYEAQVEKRIEYVEKNRSIENVDHKYVLSLLESELLTINELEQKNSTYSNLINDLFNASKDIKNGEIKTKANEIILKLRNSQQYLARGALNLKEGTQSAGQALYYYATGADLNDPQIMKEIQSLNINSKTSFDSAIIDLNNYYNLVIESNTIYRELLK